MRRFALIASHFPDSRNPNTCTSNASSQACAPPGSLHLGHFHGALKNWVKLQSEYPCFFFVADWHALTTHYDTPAVIEEHVWDMVIDWLAAGIDPARATLFIQSRVPEHAELHTLLSMITPLGWLERVPSYKDQQEKLADRDLATYGFLGYPLLQSADILMYRAAWVPVGEDQVPHVEFTREVARRFNHLFGREAGFEDKAKAAVKKLGSKKGRLYNELRTRYQEQGDEEALQAARALLNEQQNLSMGDRERLFGYLEGGGRMILAEPQALLDRVVQAAGPGRPENVQVLQQYHHLARGRRHGDEEVAHHAHRSGAGKAQRPGRPGEMPGVAAPFGIFRRRYPRLGAAGLQERRHRLPRMQAAADSIDTG